MTVHITLTIDAAGTYSFKKPDGAPQDPAGDIDLRHEIRDVDVAIKLDSLTYNLGYAFAPGPGGQNDGSAALGISDDPVTKQTFHDEGGIFSNPTLSQSPRAPAPNILTFKSKNRGGGTFYYQLNFAPGCLLQSIDPILINRV